MSKKENPILRTHVAYEGIFYYVVTSRSLEDNKFKTSVFDCTLESNTLGMFESQDAKKHFEVCSRIEEKGVGWLEQEKLHTYKVCVGCDGDLFFVKVECTKAQFDNGDHYQMARDWACSDHDVTGPYWTCDEFDPGRAVMGLCDWDTVPIITSPKNID